MNKYIVLVSGAIGGAEKRFFDIFKGLKRRDENLFLVLPSCLYDIIEKEEELTEYLPNMIILDVPKWSPSVFIKEYFKNVLKKSGENDRFHYPLSPPFFLHFIVKRKFSISFCDCHYLPKLDLKNKNASLQWLASFFASRIDILSPDIFKKACDNYRHIDRKASLTPGGTFIFPSKLDSRAKKKKFVFLSRLEENKGVDVLFDLVKPINELINSDASFEIYGEGSLSGEVERRVNALKEIGVNISFNGYGVVKDVLPEAWCVFSLQTITNYPSRVVAEALLQGSETIILDTGNSRDFGSQVGINYLEKNYSNLDQVIEVIKERKSYKNTAVINEIKQESAGKFSSQAYLDYIISLFKA